MPELVQGAYVWLECTLGKGSGIYWHFPGLPFFGWTLPKWKGGLSK